MRAVRACSEVCVAACWSEVPDFSLQFIKLHLKKVIMEVHFAVRCMVMVYCSLNAEPN